MSSSRRTLYIDIPQDDTLVYYEKDSSFSDNFYQIFAELMKIKTTLSHLALHKNAFLDLVNRFHECRDLYAILKVKSNNELNIPYRHETKMLGEELGSLLIDINKTMKGCKPNLIDDPFYSDMINAAGKEENERINTPELYYFMPPKLRDWPDRTHWDPKPDNQLYINFQSKSFGFDFSIMNQYLFGPHGLHLVLLEYNFKLFLSEIEKLIELRTRTYIQREFKLGDLGSHLKFVESYFDKLHLKDLLKLRTLNSSYRKLIDNVGIKSNYIVLKENILILKNSREHFLKYGITETQGTIRIANLITLLKMEKFPKREFAGDYHEMPNITPDDMADEHSFLRWAESQGLNEKKKNGISGFLKKMGMLLTCCLIPRANAETATAYFTDPLHQNLYQISLQGSNHWGQCWLYDEPFDKIIYAILNYANATFLNLTYQAQFSEFSRLSDCLGPTDPVASGQAEVYFHIEILRAINETILPEFEELVTTAYANLYGPDLILNAIIYIGGPLLLFPGILFLAKCCDFSYEQLCILISYLSDCLSSAVSQGFTRVNTDELKIEVEDSFEAEIIEIMESQASLENNHHIIPTQVNNESLQNDSHIPNAITSVITYSIFSKKITNNDESKATDLRRNVTSYDFP